MDEERLLPFLSPDQPSQVLFPENHFRQLCFREGEFYNSELECTEGYIRNVLIYKGILSIGDILGS
ncbi:hypothetical protein GCM10007052_30110 [Halioglobus japonicus]|nr:hypothetical protein GCM10007052_30110 [Halioglobus japonicus]